jgi:probable FeS assembly SUF system protein SufT
MPHEQVTFQRECTVVQIPQGTSLTIPQGTVVVITQALGDSYTLKLPTNGLLVRLPGKDADAIGKTVTADAHQPPHEGGPVTEAMVWEQLKCVYDPEIPINVVDLGLIYDLRMLPLPDGQQKILVQMTLTAQGCGMGPSLARDAQQRIESLPGVAVADVRIVWEPRWNPDMMSAEGKKRLGVE